MQNIKEVTKNGSQLLLISGLQVRVLPGSPDFLLTSYFGTT
jgi:hypothetical protein